MLTTATPSDTTDSHRFWCTTDSSSVSHRCLRQRLKHICHLDAHVSFASQLCSVVLKLFLAYQSLTREGKANATKAEFSKFKLNFSDLKVSRIVSACNVCLCFFPQPNSNSVNLVSLHIFPLVIHTLPAMVQCPTGVACPTV